MLLLCTLYLLSAHTAKETINLLKSLLGDKFVAKELWPPRSPDLTALDFFLWGALKGQVYSNNPQTIVQLEQNIRDAVAAYSIVDAVTELNITLGRVFQNFERHLTFCINSDGDHIERNF